MKPDTRETYTLRLKAGFSIVVKCEPGQLFPHVVNKLCHDDGAAITALYLHGPYVPVEMVPKGMHYRAGTLDPAHASEHIVIQDCFGGSYCPTSL